MSLDTLWLALALVMVIEGLFPLVFPDTWRKTFQQLLAMRDGQLRFFGLCSVVIGLICVLYLS